MSQDEVTIVQAPKKIGYAFRFKSNNEIEINMQGSKKVFILLELFKFTSDRKRMTVVVQDPENKDTVIVFTKGADDIMKEIADENQPSFNSSFAHEFSKQGFR